MKGDAGTPPSLVPKLLLFLNKFGEWCVLCLHGTASVHFVSICCVLNQTHACRLTHPEAPPPLNPYQPFFSPLCPHTQAAERQTRPVVHSTFLSEEAFLSHNLSNTAPTSEEAFLSHTRLFPLKASCKGTTICVQQQH